MTKHAIKMKENDEIKDAGPPPHFFVKLRPGRREQYGHSIHITLAQAFLFLCPLSKYGTCSDFKFLT
jgi:hypothetical protein